MKSVMTIPNLKTEPTMLLSEHDFGNVRSGDKKDLPTGIKVQLIEQRNLEDKHKISPVDVIHYRITLQKTPHLFGLTHGTSKIILANMFRRLGLERARII